jgi:hypothetical protein
MPRRYPIFVPRLTNALSDEAAAVTLQISKKTLIRKLRAGIVTAPAPVPGTCRRWWRYADIEIAREQLSKWRYEEKAS